jgi:hypothetical protein
MAYVCFNIVLRSWNTYVVPWQLFYFFVVLIINLLVINKIVYSND